MNKDFDQYLKPGKKNLITIYILYLLGITTMVPILPIIGAVFAYANKDHTTDVWKSHYIFALRSFVFGIVIYYLIEEITYFFNNAVLHYIGMSLHIFILVWVIVRSIVAMQLLLEEVKHPNPLTYWVK